LLQRWSEANELFELAADHARRLRSPLLEIWTRHEQARALHAHPRAEERRRAQRLADAAARSAQRMGLALAELHGSVETTP
jgi:hypothetical protein